MIPGIWFLDLRLLGNQIRIHCSVWRFWATHFWFKSFLSVELCPMIHSSITKITFRSVMTTIFEFLWQVFP